MKSWDLRTVDLRPHSPEILSSSTEGRAVVLEIPAGESLKDHQVHERAYLIVTSGEIQIDADGAQISGGPGLLCHFEPKERHAVTAVSDARLLLVLAPWPGEGHPSQPR